MEARLRTRVRMKEVELKGHIRATYTKLVAFKLSNLAPQWKPTIVTRS